MRELRGAVFDVCYVEQRAVRGGWRAFDVGQRDLDDLPVFGRRIWGATRGTEREVNGKVSIVWQRGCSRQA